MSMTFFFLLAGGVCFPAGLWAICRGIQGIWTGRIPELEREIAEARLKGYTREWDDPTMQRLSYLLKIACFLVCGSSSAIGGAVMLALGAFRLISSH